VRWLTYLHGLAHSDRFPAQPPQAEVQAVASAGASVDPDVHAQNGLQAGPGAPARGGGRADVPVWVQQARRHATVETWFHELVCKHFRGSLKVYDRVLLRCGCHSGLSGSLPARHHEKPTHQKDSRPCRGNRIPQRLWTDPAGMTGFPPALTSPCVSQEASSCTAPQDGGCGTVVLMQVPLWLLQPPFNEEARAQAGFGPAWYLPLAMPPKNAAAGAAGGHSSPQRLRAARVQEHGLRSAAAAAPA
jgi:hypothetical protein